MDNTNDSRIEGIVERTEEGCVELQNDLAFQKETIKNLSNDIEQLTLLQEMAKNLLFVHDKDKILKNLLDLIYEITHYRACILYFYDEERNSYYIKETQGITDKEAEEQFSFDQSLIDWIMREERWTGLPFSEQGISRREGKELVSILPLVNQSHRFGFLAIITDAGTDVYSPENIRKLNFISSQVTVSLSNEGLYSGLRETQGYLHNILESINHGIFTINSKGIITQMNRNATAMFGLSDPDIMGKNYKDIFSEDVVRALGSIRQQVRRDGFVMDYQMSYSLSEEIDIPIGINASLLTGKDMNEGDIIFVCREMSATRELERLRELDSLKDDFVSSVSHDFRSPLAAMKANVEALLNYVDMADKDTIREFLATINEEIDRLTDLLSDLLDLSRIQSGKFRLELKPVDIVRLIKKAIKNLESQNSACEIELNISADISELFLDEDKIMQVFLNLIDNALKYSPDGGKVEINLKKDNQWVIVEIIDHGIGMDEKDLPFIFDRFYRASFSDTKGISGTGLGLSIVKHIVESHRGKIEVESVLDRGTKFILKLLSKKERGKGGERDE